MIDSDALLADLKRELKTLEADLRVRADDEHTPWGARLRDEHRKAQAKQRTGLPWVQWRDGEVAQAAVAWILATVFIRFCEDNGLLAGATKAGDPVAQPWIAGPGDGLERAVENEAAFYAAGPTQTSRDWLQQAFGTLADLPAGAPLVDRAHSAVWHAQISATAADGLRDFFRRTTPDGALVHDFTDDKLDTRFLGDLYQDLSDYAKKTYALLQTPEFVETFILDLTLKPAIKEFGLTGLKMIDPACGSGHFLLGAFRRLTDAWGATAPGLDRGARVQRALDAVHGVDLNPFAIAIARFRLTVAAITASGIRTLVEAPAFTYHLAIGDSLLGGQSPDAKLDMGDGEYFAYQAEDLKEHADILTPGRYHVVVANPPYIQPPDATLRDRYRGLYPTCHGKYALSVPFMELLFRLAKPSDAASGAGFVGQITSNSFMKRGFGKKLVEQFLSGRYTGASHPSYIDLSHIVDTSGAYIPGHGTPTVILAGRPRMPQSNVVRVVFGVRREPTQPLDPAQGLVWRDIVSHVSAGRYGGTYVDVADVNRNVYTAFPWSLSGGEAVGVVRKLSSNLRTLRDFANAIGYSSITGDDEFLIAPDHVARRVYPRALPYVIGASIRDYQYVARERSMVPDSSVREPSMLADSHYHYLWRGRKVLANRLYFGKTPAERNLLWWAYAIEFPERSSADLKIAYSNIGTHNQFVADHSRAVFNAHGQVIILAEGAFDSGLLGILNSSTVGFWCRQRSYEKGSGAEPWEWRYELTATMLQELPLPDGMWPAIAHWLDWESQLQSAATPSAVFSTDPDDIPAVLANARLRWDEARRALVFLQEELDWQTYVAYGLADASLAPDVTEIVPIEANQRVMDVRLARAVAAGTETTAWFERHKRAPLTEPDGTWPQWYRALWQARCDAIDASEELRLLERPEYKRRWAGASWNDLVADAVTTALLDRLEAPELWQDGAGRALVRSVAQIADALHHDDRVRQLMTLHTGSRDYDLQAQIAKLLAGQAVPPFAPLRYKPSGQEKFRAWQHTWELQRAEDRGETVDVPVPPKYTKADFARGEYWTARGKLDVPKERFLSFPGAHVPDDTTDLYGWAGWDHAERAQAIARLAVTLTRAAAPDSEVIPLVGALVELQPWLDQWYTDIDARSGVSPASAVAGATASLLARLGMGADTVTAWRPAPATRGRKKKA